jgi:hypothetical protein
MQLHEKFRRPERGAPVSYRYNVEDLLALLHESAPAKVDAVALHRRRVEHGYLSVGLKIHCLGDGSQFSTLVEGLGGAKKNSRCQLLQTLSRLAVPCAATGGQCSIGDTAFRVYRALYWICAFQ